MNHTSNNKPDDTMNSNSTRLSTRPTVDPARGVCRRNTRTPKTFPRWSPPPGGQSGRLDAGPGHRRGRPGGSTTGPQPPRNPRPRLRAALTLALLVWAGAASAQEVQVERVGQWPGWPRGDAKGVAVSGNYAYVADRNWGLQILRIEPVPRLDGPFGLTAEGFAAWLNAPVAGTYRIEVSSDLAAWEALVTLTNVSGRVRVVAPAATSAAQRFYRAVRVP